MLGVKHITHFTDTALYFCCWVLKSHLLPEKYTFLFFHAKELFIFFVKKPIKVSVLRVLFDLTPNLLISFPAPRGDLSQAERYVISCYTFDPELWVFRVN